MSPSSPIFFESILFYNGQFPFLNLHLKRIEDLASNYRSEFRMSLGEFESLLRASLHKGSEQKLRLKLNIDGPRLRISCIESEIIFNHSFNQYLPIKLSIYPHYLKPLEKQSAWKYENPKIYKDSIAHAFENNASQSILINEHGEIVETSLSNFFYIIDEKIYTPPLHSGAVNGVFRRYLMSKVDIQERCLHLNELELINECFVTSAVRGIVGVYQIDTNDFLTCQIDRLKKDLAIETTIMHRLSDR